MYPWLGAIAAGLLASAGSLLGYWFSRWRKLWWTLGYFIPLSLVLIYAMARQLPGLFFTPPVSWMMLGRKKFVVIGFITTMVLTTPLSRLPRKRDRILVSLLMALMVFALSVWPFLLPVFDRNQLAHLQTRLGADGVCLQNTDYTCGPAAAVTALRQLGLPAEESQIAILSLTSSAYGTPPDLLAEALQRNYGPDGLRAEYRPFKDIADLKRAGLTLAVIKYAILVDHYVVVFEVTDADVIVGDPLNGRYKMSHAEFRKIWRYQGVVLRRKQPDKIHFPRAGFAYPAAHELAAV
jgi:predicted double-glycine peptidase